jgi:molybdopterin synthase catalytic subunit
MYVRVSNEPLNPLELMDRVRQDEAGALVLFSGVVRDNNLGRSVEYLEYDAYPEMAEKVLTEIADELFSNWQLTDIAVQHRTGKLGVGEASLLVAVSAPHRTEAFSAAQLLVDRLKELVPIWKKETFDSGEQWVAGTTHSASQAYLGQRSPAAGTIGERLET